MHSSKIVTYHYITSLDLIIDSEPTIGIVKFHTLTLIEFEYSIVANN